MLEHLLEVLESVGNLDVEIPGFTPKIMLEHPTFNLVASDRIIRVSDIESACDYKTGDS